MALRDVVEAIVRTPSTGYTNFQVKRDAGDGPDRFVPGETYVEIRLTKMLLRDRRQLWRDFIPLASLMTEFLFGAGRVVVPFVVGPDLLARAPNHASGDLVEFFGRRVAGPFPYEGDDVVLFASLARVETENWAKRAMSVLGTVASAFDVSRISSYMDIAGALTGALQDLLGMKEVEQRIGVQCSYCTPPEDRDHAVPDGALNPGYAVFINAESQLFPAERRARFSVHDSRLHEGDSEFREQDFIVLELVPLEKRPDYTSFDFHRVHWREAEKLVFEGREEDAWRRFDLLAADLVMNDDFVRNHRVALLDYYSEALRADVAKRKQVFSRGGQKGFSAAAVLRQIGEAELGAAVLAHPRSTARTPEEMLASVRH